MSPGEESASSVDVFWRSKDGFEMHLQLNGTSSEEILDESHRAIDRIKKAGGEPRPHRNNRNSEDSEPAEASAHKCSVCGKKMKYREGEGRNGKPYKGYFCPDRDCEGKPVWIDA